ncbi:structural maintenance of chromosomes protein 2-like [Sinocyclocheilus grahami]|uniref:structural maintenance of chromosomes protein 2-like n=1 Tax=Sinocyclocheilus grahami TaxID=75366 RepID=UPI0007AD27CB|nr:PREDICTED: structural maintenance of chromosomes protein 2-like [Sinocyclocheilus grahami]
MYIKSIVLEGFKSYAERTEINGFDPFFNAITGLNGSGKSNILDSICFLLGISNLSQVRATNLQDLVYKNGLAGITKATVSITFDNSNKKQSPLGFETHDEITITRQVVIGGRNKYLINGVNANNLRVQDLFCSVGLNVNNPHFLIMQGRITKVLNMKPPEILAMIEEAAGTRMYECKKISAQKTIEKKDAKLKEIQTILDEEITPAMEKLKEERASYLEYQKLMREIEHLSRLYVAYLFVCAEETKLKSTEDLQEMQSSIAQLQENMKQNEAKVKELSTEIQELERRRDKAQMKLKHAQQELKTKQAQVKKMDSGYKKDQDTFEAVKKCIEKLQAEMKKLNYEDGREERLLEQKRQCSRDVSQLRETYESLMGQFPNLRFEYTDPEKNWDPSKVKGLVANLFSVTDVSNATALEVVAGGRLYNIVVDNEVTGKKLLEKGELKRRYTIIPLNKISARTLNDNVVRTAKNLVGPDNVHTALSLVGYESELRKAMEYVFGTTLVCDSLDNAKKVAFDKGVSTKTVTLGGDVFDPQGTLTGGARAQTASVLSKLAEVKDIQDSLRAKEAELTAVESELSSLKGTAEKYRQLKQQLDLKTEEARILETKLQQSSFHKQQEELENLRKTIEECEETLQKTKEVHKKAEEKYKVLENKMKNAEAEREKELKAAQQKLNQAKSKADAYNKRLKEKQQEADAVTLELEELKREQAGYEQQIQAVDEALKAIQEQIDTMTTEVFANKEAVRAAQEQLSQQKKVILGQEREIKGKTGEANRLREQNNDAQLKIKELEHNISKHKKDSADATAKVARMLAENDWISSEKHLFGQPNTAYDFKTNNPKEAGQRLKRLEETKDKLERNVNRRAMNMLSEAEERYNDLKKKKRIVENDKAKILETIEELDQKKNEALNVAWQKVK